MNKQMDEIYIHRILRNQKINIPIVQWDFISEICFSTSKINGKPTENKLLKNMFFQEYYYMILVILICMKMD